MVRSLVVAGVLMCSHAAMAERPSELALKVARVCYLEASFQETDCVIIWHVARKRAAAARGIELADVVAPDVVAMLAEYSAIRARNPRAQEVSAFPDSDLATRGARWNAKWAHLRALALELCEGMHPDPCPLARHWGGSMDPPHGGMVPAHCASGVTTANTFYAVRR